jgi:hypothetical protein
LWWKTIQLFALQIGEWRNEVEIPDDFLHGRTEVIIAAITLTEYAEIEIQKPPPDLAG